MESCQMEWIERNGPALYNLTEVSQKLLDKLCSRKLLHQSDVNELRRIGKHEKDGFDVQKSELYHKLMKNDCFDDLIEVLLDCGQKGASKLLQKAKDDVLNLLQNVPDSKNHSSRKEEENRRPRLFGKIPLRPSYYIPRSIRPNCVLNKKLIFEETNAIFLFTGIKPHDLSSYLGWCSIDKSGSQVRQMSLSVSHIILEAKNHFEKICELAKGKAVHWIHYENGQFIWARSGNGDMSSIQRASKGITEQNELLTETQFLLQLEKKAKAYGNSPVVIADTPAMGKSTLLHSFAREIVGGSLGKRRAVIFVVISELVKLLRKMSKSKLTEKTLENALIQLTTEAAADNKSLQTLFQEASQSRDEVKIELMLDGYDELNFKELPLAHDIFSLVRNSYPSARIWVATRPHLLHQLENMLQVTSCTILPFQESDQEQFLVSFWHSKICKNPDCKFQQSTACSNVNLNLVRKVAKHCLKTLEVNCCFKGPREGDICGVPLQCLMLAEVFHEDCLNFVNKENWTTDEEPVLSVKIASIKDMYGALIEVKLKTYAERYFSKPLRPKRRVHLLNQHYYLALQLLFPSCAELFLEKLQWSGGNASSPTLDEKEILKVGIVEYSEVAEDECCSLPRFIHRTIAEFLVARWIVDELSPEEETPTRLEKFKTKFSKKTGSNSSTRLPLILMEEVFRTESPERRLDWQLDPYEFEKFDKFVHQVIVFFVDSLLGGRDLENCGRFGEFESLQDGRILFASVYHDHFNIFQIFSSGETPSTLLPIDELLCEGVKHASLNFLKVLFDKFGKFLESEKCGNSIIQQKSDFLKCAVEYREYSVVDYFLSCHGLAELVQDFDPLIRDLLHPLVRDSIRDPGWLVKEKKDVLERLVQLQPKLLESGENDFSPVTSPLLQSYVHVELILKLVDLGADLLVRDTSNSTLLHKSWSLGGEDYHRVVNRLSEEDQVLEQLVNVRSADKDNSTAIHVIAQFLRPPMKATLECLLRNGADFTSTDRRGRNCIHVAVECGTMDAARILLEFEVVREILNEKDAFGQTPLDILTLKGSSSMHVGVYFEEFQKLLVKHGARLSQHVEVEG